MEAQKTYTYDEAFNASLAYFGGDELVSSSVGKQVCHERQFRAYL